MEGSGGARKKELGIQTRRHGVGPSCKEGRPWEEEILLRNVPLRELQQELKETRH